MNYQSHIDTVSPSQITVRENILHRADLTSLIIATGPMWLLAVITESVFVADVAAIIAISLLLIWFWKCLGDSVEMVRLLRLGAFSLCIMLNISWITSSIIHHFVLNKSIISTLSTAMGGGMKFSSYALAMFYITVFSAIISYLGSKQKLLNLESWISNGLLTLKTFPIKRVIYFIIMLTTIDFYLIYSGIIGQRSIIVEGYTTGERPFWIVLYESILPSQIILNVLLLINIKSKKFNLFTYFILFASIIIVSYIYFTKGRRDLVFSVISFGFWYYFFLGKKPHLIKLIVVISIVYPLLSQLLLFNNFIRGVNGFSNWQSRSAIELLPQAWEKFSSSSRILNVERASTTSNMASRPLVATPLALCLQYPDQWKSFTTGENLLNSAIQAIPGPLFTNKRAYLTQEALLYKHFRIGRDLNQDTADSLYLTSYIEFSWLGLIIYPFLLYGLWLLVINLCRSWKLSGIFLMISVSIFFQLFIVGIGESAVTAWWVTLRSFIFWAVMYKVIVLFFKRKYIIRI